MKASTLLKTLSGQSIAAAGSLVLDQAYERSRNGDAQIWRPVTIEIGGEILLLRVAPNYWEYGEGDDRIMMPMTLPIALEVAKLWGAILPTPRMVEAIWTQAVVKVAAHPTKPDAGMVTVARAGLHDLTAKADLYRAEPTWKREQLLVGGHKKDLVDLPTRPTGKLGIYGWHGERGPAIQPVSFVHDENYVDYSHGVRLVSWWAEYGGKTFAMDDLFKHDVVGPALLQLRRLVV